MSSEVFLSPYESCQFVPSASFGSLRHCAIINLEALPSGAAARLFGALVGVQKVQMCGAAVNDASWSRLVADLVSSQAGGFLQDVRSHGEQVGGCWSMFSSPAYF